MITFRRRAGGPRLLLVGRVVVRRLGLELGGAGVDGLVDGRARRARASARARTSASSTPHSPSWASEKPSRLARRQSRASCRRGRPRRGRLAPLDDDARIWSRNHGSTRWPRRASIVRRAAARLELERPVRRADGGARERARRRRARRVRLGRVAGAAARPCSSERSAFCSASVNVRPIAIASPTDFICVPSTPGRRRGTSRTRSAAP
jgi:hypothetical protein